MKVCVKGTQVPLIGIFLLSCATSPDQNRAPYGYEPNYDYLAILQSSPNYAYEDATDYPAFSYQEPTDDSLTLLRVSYDLDSIAGNGDELSRILNLLGWASRTLTHDGQSSSPDPETSLNILRHTEETGSGVNCVMKAIVLNDAFLSVGLKSRVIHGNGRDWVFNGEWHAFNAVYSSALSKWVLVDPTNRAYFVNSAGDPLSVAEVRDHLKHDSQLFLNDDAEYNGGPVDETRYLHYMSKNLYRFSTSAQSGFGRNGVFHLNSSVPRVMIHLDPPGNSDDGLGAAENHFTSNPDYYWQRP